MPALSTIVLLVAVIVAGIAGSCSTPEEPAEKREGFGQGVNIGPAWQSARNVSGHAVHVLDRGIACAKCHEFSGDAIGKAVPGRCTPCHEHEARIEHAKDAARRRFGADAKADCTDCHAFKLGGAHHSGALPAEAPPSSDCSSCHSMPQGELPVISVHGSSDCLQCHRPHDDAKPESAPCDGCHADVSTRHAARERHGNALCTTCHEHQHAMASDAVSSCAGCHRTNGPAVPATALFPGGHEQCTTCHEAHAFERERAVVCRNCHAGKPVLAAPRVAEHARCTSCHDAHDVRAASDRTCTGCHSQVHADHPKIGKGATCTGCHDPHPAAAHAATSAAACSSCHREAHGDQAFHGGSECRHCHEPHDFKLNAADRTLCAACHGVEVGHTQKLLAHAACESCHGGLPHHPRAPERGCESCHAGVHASATAGHQRCTNCHEPHAGEFVTECRTCHAKEHSSAPRGHQSCTTCHEQHTGRRTATCAGCHAGPAASPHGKVGGADCSSCHRAHGPGGVAAPPSCTSCHDRSRLPGLHAVSKHATCRSCHSGHDAVNRAVRSDCTSCHRDRQAHFPEAPSCASCHLFTAAR